MTDLPRVTTILRATGLAGDLSMVPGAVLEAARDRGNAVHAAAEALVYGYFEPETVPPVAAPYVSALQKFLAESGFEPIAAEIQVVDLVWRFQGHPDLIGWLRGLRTVIDLKTGDDTGAAYQVAGYAQGWGAQHPTQPIQAGAVVHLRNDGTYRYDEVSLAAATPVWQAAVIIFYAQPERRAA